MRMADLTSLADSFQPLKQHFLQVARLRLLVVVSPT
jgi:hypothetical protein